MSGWRKPAMRDQRLPGTVFVLRKNKITWCAAGSALHDFPTYGR